MTEINIVERYIGDMIQGRGIIVGINKLFPNARTIEQRGVETKLLIYEDISFINLVTVVVSEGDKIIEISKYSFQPAINVWECIRTDYSEADRQLILAI